MEALEVFLFQLFKKPLFTHKSYEELNTCHASYATGQLISQIYRILVRKCVLFCTTLTVALAVT